jgi:hypothetical protein
LQTACDKAGVGRSTYYLWRRDDKDFLQKAEGALRIGKEFINDMCESMLIKNIQAANNTALIFWLKNHHPEYCEKILHKYELAEQTITEAEGLEIARALTNIGLASILRKETRNKLDERAKEQKQKELAIANARDEGKVPQDKLEETIVKLGNGKKTTIKAHLDHFEEEERKRKENCQKILESNKGERKGVNLKEFFENRKKERIAKEAEVIKKLSPADLEFCRKYNIDPLTYKQ